MSSDEGLQPPSPLQERELREIFVQLSRLNGKFDTVKQDFLTNAKDIETLTKRLDDLEATQHEEAIRNAVEDERKKIVRYVIDGILLMVSAAVGAGYFFGGT